MPPIAAARTVGTGRTQTATAAKHTDFVRNFEEVQIKPKQWPDEAGDLIAANISRGIPKDK